MIVGGEVFGMELFRGHSCFNYRTRERRWSRLNHTLVGTLEVRGR